MSQPENVEDDFVLLEAEESYIEEVTKASFYAQVEEYLTKQINKCEYYKKVFGDQSNDTMATRFATYAENSARDLEILRASWKNGQVLPKYKFEHVNFNCLPVHIDVKDRELQISVKTSKLSSSPDALVYAIAEFDFPISKDESFADSVSRWLHTVRIEPKSFLCCPSAEARQLDIIYSTDLIPFNHPNSKMVEYDRPLSFFVEKGKSRTLKRKFKPIKLTFWEKTSLIRRDKKLGMVQIKVDSINDENTSVARLPIMIGRKQTELVADIRVRVREPLVNKSIRAHEEKLLLLTS